MNKLVDWIEDNFSTKLEPHKINELKQVLKEHAANKVQGESFEDMVLKEAAVIFENDGFTVIPEPSEGGNVQVRSRMRVDGSFKRMQPITNSLDELEEWLREVINNSTVWIDSRELLAKIKTIKQQS